MISVDQSDLAAIDKRLSSMLEKLDHFGRVELGEVMSSWQVGDVHRHRPFTMRWRGRQRKVVTMFRPHSRWEMKRELRLTRRALRRHQVPHAYSTRPVLREVMWDRLVSEMTAAFQSAIKW
jgi:hypothetical protein